MITGATWDQEGDSSRKHSFFHVGVEGPRSRTVDPTAGVAHQMVAQTDLVRDAELVNPGTVDPSPRAIGRCLAFCFGSFFVSAIGR